jgi:hypothetical protein
MAEPRLKNDYTARHRIAAPAIADRQAPQTASLRKNASQIAAQPVLMN